MAPKGSREQSRRKADSKAAKVRKVQLDASGSQSHAKQKTLRQINQRAEKVSTRFRYASFNQRLQDVHLAPAAITASTSYRPYSGLEAPLASTSLPSIDAEEDEDQESSLHAKTSFAQALEVWTELNLSNAFQDLFRQVKYISQSLPQLIHHRSTISAALSHCLSRPDQYLAWDAALDLLPRLAKDLGSEFLPIYADSLRSAIHITTTTKATTNGDERAAATLVERGFQSAAWILKAISPLIVSKHMSAAPEDDDEVMADVQDAEEEVDQRTQRFVETWLVIRPYLGWKPIPASRIAAQEQQQPDDDEEDSDEEDDADLEQPSAAPSAFVNTNLQRISPFTRRFASEAFAHLMRRTRGVQLRNVSTLILHDLATMLAEEDKQEWYRKHADRRPSVLFSRGIAGIWVEACKSVDRRLHSKTITLLAVLFDTSRISADDASSDARHAHLTRLIVGRLTIMALNHAANATHFAPVLDLVSELVESHRSRLLASLESQKSTAASGFAGLTESVEWLATAVGVRKGSRVGEAAKAPLFSLLLRLAPLFLHPAVQGPHGAGLRTSLITLYSLCLPIGRIQDLIGPGIKLIEAVAPVPTAGTSSEVVAQRQTLWPEFSGLVEALAEPNVEWDGFKQFVLPSVLTSTAETVASSSTIAQSKDQAITLLERLDKLGQLQHVRTATPSPSLTRWSNLISAEIEARLQKLVLLFCGDGGSKKKVNAAKVLSDQATLEPLIPAIRLATVPRTTSSDRFVELITRLVTDSLLTDTFLSSAVQARQAYDTHIINPPLLLSLALSSLSSLEDAGRKKQSQLAVHLFSTPDTIARVVRCASWHRGAFGGISKLALASKSRGQLQLPSIPDVFAELAVAVMSSDPAIRLAALEVLSLIESGTGDSFFEKLVEVENTPLTVASIRDRNVRMRAVGRDLGRQVAAYKAGDAAKFRQRNELILRYVLASFKINLKPIWAEASKTIVEILASGHQSVGETLFNAALAEIQAGRQVDSNELRVVPNSWTEGKRDSSDHLVDADEVEPDRILRSDTDASGLDNDKHFQDGILLARRKSARSCIEHARSSSGARSSTSLSTTLVDCIAMQTPDARLDLVNYRLQILHLFGELSAQVERYNTAFVDVFFRDAGPRNFAGVYVTPLDDENEDVAAQDPVEMVLGKKDRQAQLTAYLSIFAKLKKPQALHRAEDLHSYFLSLVASAEVAVQKVALDAILAWKDDSITPYDQKLKDLLGNETFRDTLTTFTLSTESDMVQPYHRPVLMPLVIRILFGALLSRRGNKTSGSGQKSRRGAVLAALAEINPDELVTLVDLMLAPFGDQAEERASNQAFAFTKTEPVASTRRQAGFLTLLSDVVKQLGSNLIPYWDRLIGVTLNLTYHAHKEVTLAHTADEAEESRKTLSARTSQARHVRQSGYKRLCDFFNKQHTASVFTWDLFMPALFAELVSPRLADLRVESTQSPSALLELLHVWSSQAETIRLLGLYDNAVLPNVFAILEAPVVKPSAISCVLDITERVLAAAAAEEKEGSSAVPHMSAIQNQASILDLLVKPHASAFLNSVAPLIEAVASASGSTGSGAGRDELLRREISVLSSLSPFITRPEDATHLLQILLPMMKKSNHLVPEHTKTELLTIFERLLSLTPEFQDKTSATFVNTYAMFSGLFSILRSGEAKKSLSAALTRFADIDKSLARVCSWCSQLNALSKRRVEERDFDQMFAAFDVINNTDTPITVQEWLPLVHNMLACIRDPDELSVRSNANVALVKFVHQTAAESGQGAQGGHPMMELFAKAVWPGLKKAIRSKSELVRRDVLAVMSAAVENLGQDSNMAELTGLLADGDSEANFFNNIHHIQIHRRTRAVRRLADQAAKGEMKSKTIADILAPLLGHFLITGSVQLNDHNLVTEVITTLGKLAAQMQWGAYNALLWQYLRLANEKGSAERVMVRTAMSILDNFHFSMDDEAIVTAEEAAEEEQQQQQEAGEDVVREQKKEEAQRVKILDAVSGKLLPALMSYLETNDETEDSTRLPIAVGVVRVAQRLPAQQRQQQLTKLIRTLSNILRSKSQETRDLTRETLCKVMAALGATYLPEMLKEMRRSLMRGPQKAVMAFAVHSVLTHLMTNVESPLTLLDDGAKDIIEIAVEDVFGGTADDRESIGNKTTYREVKHSKSMDTFEQVARVVSPARIADVLQPLRDILQQTEVPKAVRQVEEALRRISSGIPANPQFDSNRFLVLCATLIRRDAGFLQARKPEAKATSKNKSATLYNYSVFLKRKDVEEGPAQDHYSRNAHKFVSFGLEMLVTALRRERFDFKDDEVLAKLNSLVNVVGETAYASESGVLELSLRAIAQLVKVPVAQVDKALPVFIKQIFGVIHQYGSPQSEVVQTAFRTLTAILRECKQASLSETHLSGLVKLIAPDLEEPAVQNTLFGLLRAIVSRKFVVSEVYDTMDKVAEMLVTNQSHSVRDLCRSTYLQFLLDYPQGKQRLRNQLAFLAKNLAYEHESGRLSVLQITAAIFNKFGDELLQDYTEMFFVALAMMLANDSSSKCREEAAALVKVLVGTMSSSQQDKTVQMVHAWAEQENKVHLARVGIQIYGLMIESLPERSADWAAQVLNVVSRVLVDSAEELDSLETTPDVVEEGLELEWQLVYHSLQTLGRLPKTTLKSTAAVKTVNAVRGLLLYPHNWVRKAATRLLWDLHRLSEPQAPVMVSADVEPLLSLPALVDAAKKLCLQLRSQQLERDLAMLSILSLVQIARSLALAPFESDATDANDSDAASVDAEDAGANGQEQRDEDENDEEGYESSVMDDAEEREADMDAPKLIVEDPLKWLVGRLSFQARRSLSQAKRQDWTFQPDAILRMFSMLAAELSPERTATVLRFMLSPIIRIVESNNKTSEEEDLKKLALEMQGQIQEKVPVALFNASYSQLKRAQEHKRQERRTARLMRGIHNPDQEAARKQKRNVKNHQARKRRNETHLKKREAGGSTAGREGKKFKRTKRE